MSIVLQSDDRTEACVLDNPFCASFKQGRWKQGILFHSSELDEMCRVTDSEKKNRLIRLAEEAVLPEWRMRITDNLLRALEDIRPIGYREQVVLGVAIEILEKINEGYKKPIGCWDCNIEVQDALAKIGITI